MMSRRSKPPIELAFEIVGTCEWVDRQGNAKTGTVVGAPISCCQKCREAGRITSCERMTFHDEWTFVCPGCRRQWIITL